MRAYRKRTWAKMVADLTPLIDVIFLIIIFFVVLINFSQVHVRNVVLPNADQSYPSANANQQSLPITLRAKDEIFLGKDQISLAGLSDEIRRRYPNRSEVTAIIRANEDIPYELIKLIMIKLAELNIDKVEFATWEGTPDPLLEPPAEMKPNET